MMEIKSNSNIQSEQEQNAEVGYKPLIDLFELLLEWDLKDVQEKEEKRKEV